MRRLFATRTKRRGELAYWRERVAQEGLPLANFWYERAWTDAFGLPRSHYSGKRVLDVGCGPRGSLTWADDAAERVGADPLAAEYERLQPGVELGMRFVTARSESLPFEDASFDVVGCFNALDHVEDVDGAIAEMVRVLAPDGDLLLVVEVDHEPTALEPWTLEWDLLSRFAPGVEVVSERHVEHGDPAIYVSLERDEPFDHARGDRRSGLLVAHLRRAVRETSAPPGR